MKDPRSTTLHEIEHAVQQREGFDPGGTPTPGPIEGKYITKSEAYRRNAGETEARNVQARRDLNAEARRLYPPWMTEDVPRDQQILHRTETGHSEREALTASGEAWQSRFDDAYQRLAAEGGSPTINIKDLSSALGHPPLDELHKEIFKRTRSGQGMLGKNTAAQVDNGRSFGVKDWNGSDEPYTTYFERPKE
jgi:hypothetical protein